MGSKQAGFEPSKSAVAVVADNAAQRSGRGSECEREGGKTFGGKTREGEEKGQQK